MGAEKRISAIKGMVIGALAAVAGAIVGLSFSEMSFDHTHTPVTHDHALPIPADYRWSIIPDGINPPLGSVTSMMVMATATGPIGVFGFLESNVSGTWRAVRQETFTLEQRQGKEEQKEESVATKSE